MKKKYFEELARIRDLEKELQNKDTTIAELTAVVAYKDKQIENYANALERANVSVSEYRERLNNIPEDCKPGDYCRACEFGELLPIKIYNPYGADYIQHCYICMKGGCCSNFVKKAEA